MEKTTNEENKTQPTNEATSVGMFLKYTRLSQKKSIETVSKALCIRKIYLNAIEADNYKELPPIPYGVGFVRSYAGYLGLNAERIVQCYKEEALPHKRVVAAKPVAAKQQISTLPSRKQIFGGLAALVFLYFVWLTYSHLTVSEDEVTTIRDEAPTVEIIENETSPEDILPEEDITPEPVNEEKDITASVKTAGVSEPAPTDISEPETTGTGMVVKFKGKSWFEIRDKNKVYISGIYGKGFEYKVPDVPGLIFSVGRQKNVDVYIDGKLVKITRPNKQTKIKLDAFLKH